MQNPIDLERCRSFVNYQLQPAKWTKPAKAASIIRAVTISRQAGCGAGIVAGKISKLLQEHSQNDECPWTIFDRNLMTKVLEDHHLSARIAKFLPEDRITELEDITDELFGLRPASWTVIEQTSETILRLVELGNVIIIGRGGNVITASLPNILHVRLVAPHEKRIEHAQTFYEMTQKEAREFCVREDLGRARYLKKYFKSDINDPLLYHLIINTGLVSYDEAAELIVKAAAPKSD